ncbi:MAG: macro domain-containing protein, partial [Clostridia bacterium]|nr:macro domain-containing protein [Clostridia bacterium]
REALLIAEELGCETVAFPLISAGVYGYPKRQALDVAEREIRAFLEEHEMTVTMVIFDSASFMMASELRGEIDALIDDDYVSGHTFSDSNPRRRRLLMEAKARQEKAKQAAKYDKYDKPEAAPSAAYPAMPSAAGSFFGNFASAAPVCEACEEAADIELPELDESFSRNLLRRIDESGMTDAECYKRANIDRKLFSKIRSDEHYRPSKPTALAFAIALKLDLPNTEDLIRRAGFALSRSERFDVIVEYFIKNRRWDIYEINEALFAYDQPLLGNVK